MSKKLTPWFPPEVKPVRVGPYNASKTRDPKAFRYWDGRAWGFVAFSVEGAVSARLFKTSEQHRVHWRGLAEQPK